MLSSGTAAAASNQSVSRLQTSPTGSTHSISLLAADSAVTPPEPARGTDVGTLAKRTNGNVKTPSSGALSSTPARFRSPVSPRREDLLDDDEADEPITEDDLSIENYMRRHPCVLDRGSAFLDRHSWLYQVAVVSLTLIGVVCGGLVASSLRLSPLHLTLIYAFVVADFALYATVCRRSPGRPARCADEASVIQLLHSWPASSRHYGLHASEWSRSWSFCDPCSNWRPARAHHCSKCGECVLMRDHHCVWIGQCVGANNLRVFFAYVALTTALSIYAIGLACYYIQRPASSLADGTEIDLSLFLILAVVGLCGSSAAGWLVIRCVHVAVSNETGLEGLKKIENSQARVDERVAKQHTSTHDASDAAAKSLRRNTAGQRRDLASAPALHSEHVRADVPRAASAPNVTKALTQVLSPDSDMSSPSPDVSVSPVPAGRFFSPFQCSCHAASFRVFYCQTFNYPSLTRTASPIPPLPFYHDYDAGGDWYMNYSLFMEDLRRAEKLHRWVQNGARPIAHAGKHMRLQTKKPAGANAAAHASDQHDRQPLLLQEEEEDTQARASCGPVPSEGHESNSRSISSRLMQATST